MRKFFYVFIVLLFTVTCNHTMYGQSLNDFDYSRYALFGSGKKSHVAPVRKSQILTNEKNQNYPSYTSFLE